MDKGQGALEISLAERIAASLGNSNLLLSGKKEASDFID